MGLPTVVDIFSELDKPGRDPRPEFKVAALAKTIAFPLDPFNYLGDPRLVLALLLGFVGCAISWIAAIRSSQQNA